MVRILLPKTKSVIAPHPCDPLFFLAGPVRGGDDWQYQACIKIQRHLSQFYAALPCRYEETHPLMQYRMGGNTDFFDRQLTWERYYLERASEEGCIIFWLPEESKLNPREGNEPYAMDTRGELGEWRGHRKYRPNVRLVVGAEKGFPGLSQIERNFRLALGYDFPIYPTLEATVWAAVQMAIK